MPWKFGTLKGSDNTAQSRAAHPGGSTCTLPTLKGLNKWEEIDSIFVGLSATFSNCETLSGSSFGIVVCSQGALRGPGLCCGTASRFGIKLPRCHELTSNCPHALLWKR